MIRSGELFLLNGETCGELRPLPKFLNQNICVIAANFDRAYVVCEPPVAPPPDSDVAEQRPCPCTVWCFRGDDCEPVHCPEFEGIQGTIVQIAIGEKHLLVLTEDGTVYSRGPAIYGSAGHGGALDVPEFRPVPALRQRRVRFVAAGPYFSLAITLEGDIFSWGQAFNGETGLFGQVEAVPRFAPEVTRLRVVAVSCGQGHVLARTEAQQCLSWGENTCGQLGLGQKSKPTYKPQLLDCIPSRVQDVSAGWAHSIAVGVDGRVYSWGLNTHGQLGLGDTTTKLSPHLMEDLLGVHHIESAQAAKTLSLLYAVDCRLLLCGQIPRAANAVVKAEFYSRRAGEDPEGCVLVPVPLPLCGSFGSEISHSQLSQIIAFDKGALGVARSTVYHVSPNLAPVQGGTLVRARVTGLPFEAQGRKSESVTRPIPMQDGVPLKVHLHSTSPACDVTVDGQIVDAEIVEFSTPSVAETPLGQVVEQGFTSAVQLRVSIDDGLTWTSDRHAVPTAEELDQTVRTAVGQRGETKSLQRGLEDLKEEFITSRRVQEAIGKGSTVLWYCRWPHDGPSHVEPGCAPVTGGTELLLHVQLPHQMPAEHLIVKFICDPLHSIGDPELESRAPMRRDAAEIINPSYEDIARLPLVGLLEVPVCAWLDPGGQGVRCVSPPLDAESVRLYRYFVQLSLDGCVFLERMLPFAVFDLRVTGLEPNLGPLLEQTQVKVKATGVVESDILRVRVDFPKDLGWDSRVLPASLDHTSGEIVFMMPDLVVEVRRRLDEAHSTGLASVALPAPTAEDGAANPLEIGHHSAEPDGGLHGLEVCIELSLNGQNFTEDRMYFTYFGPLEADAIQVLTPVEVSPAEPAQAKDAKKGKVVTEEPAYAVVKSGVKVGCPVRPVMESTWAILTMQVMTKSGEEEPVFIRELTMPANLEKVQPPPPPPPEPDPKAAKAAAAVVPEPPVDVDPVEMLTCLIPEIPTEDLNEGTIVLLGNFSVSLNGQSFTQCEVQQPLRFEP